MQKKNSSFEELKSFREKLAESVLVIIKISRIFSEMQNLGVRPKKMIVCPSVCLSLRDVMSSLPSATAIGKCVATEIGLFLAKLVLT